MTSFNVALFLRMMKYRESIVDRYIYLDTYLPIKEWSVDWAAKFTKKDLHTVINYFYDRCARYEYPEHHIAAVISGARSRLTHEECYELISKLSDGSPQISGN